MKSIFLAICIAFVAISTHAQNVGIGTTNPQSKLSVGSNSQFQVDSIGNIKRVNNVPLSFPAAQGSNGQVLQNDGNGNLSWSTINMLQKSGSVIMLDTYDTTLLSQGFTFMGKMQSSAQTKIADSSSWQWGNDLNMTNAPAARYGHSAIWTGTEMIIWGGYDTSYNYVNTGFRYNPLTNVWVAITTTNAPSGRGNHSAIWTGTEMIVWGGTSGTPAALNDGGRYNPSTNSWGTVPTSTNAPSARVGHSAIWTGTEMIIWGGGSGGIYINDGSKYNPTTNTWATATSLTNAPTGRDRHSSVWTGTEMITWGGFNSSSGTLNDGGRYNPSTNSWTNIMSINARAYHSAIWTGSEMIIWGGISGASSPLINTNGRRFGYYTPTFGPITNVYYYLFRKN